MIHLFSVIEKVCGLMLLEVDMSIQLDLVEALKTIVSDSEIHIYKAVMKDTRS